MGAVKKGYLSLYNVASAVLWSVVLGRTVAVAYLRGPSFVPIVVNEWTRYTQTLALMEILHALTGGFSSRKI